MKKIVFIAVILLFAVLIILRFSELEQIINILEDARWEYLFIGAILQAVGFLTIARAYQLLYGLMDIKERLLQLYVMAFAVFFVSVVAPSGGMSGVAVFISEAKKRNQPRGAALAVYALNVFIDYISLFVMLAVGFVILLRRRSVNAGELSAAGILTVATIIFGWLITIGVLAPDKFGKVLANIIQKINRILRPIMRRDYISEEQAERFAFEVTNGLAILRTEHKDLLWPLVYSLWNRFIQIGILWMCFLSFNVDYSLGTLVAGYAIGVLFVVVSPTPAGIGIVEGGLPLVLANLNVPIEEGILVTLAYRAITFWFPLAFGALAFRQIQRDS